MNAGAFNLGAGLSFAILPAIMIINQPSDPTSTNGYFSGIVVGLIITIIALVASFMIPRPKDAEL